MPSRSDRPALPDRLEPSRGRGLLHGDERLTRAELCPTPSSLVCWRRSSHRPSRPPCALLLPNAGPASRANSRLTTKKSGARSVAEGEPKARRVGRSRNILTGDHQQYGYVRPRRCGITCGQSLLRMTHRSRARVRVSIASRVDSRVHVPVSPHGRRRVVYTSIEGRLRDNGPSSYPRARYAPCLGTAVR